MVRGGFCSSEVTKVFQCGHAGAFFGHVAPAVIAFGAYVLQGVVLDPVVNFLRRARFAGSARLGRCSRRDAPSPLGSELDCLRGSGAVQG